MIAELWRQKLTAIEIKAGRSAARRLLPHPELT
jgi:hypothetical protein